MSSSSDEDELEDGQYEMSSESKKFGLMSKHRDKVGAILTSAKNGKLNRLRSQLEEYAAEHRKEAQKEKSKESAQGEGEGEGEGDGEEEITASSLIREIKDGPGRSIVHFAASRGHMKTCRMLLDMCPAAVSVTDDDGATPLALAAARGSEKTVTLLLERGASPMVADKSGVLPIHHAASEGHPDVIRALSTWSGGTSSGGSGDVRAMLDAQSGSGAPLHWAAGSRKAPCVATLIEAGADVNAKNGSGLTPVLLAAAASDGASVALLARAGADVGHVLQGGLTVAHIVADLALPSAVEAILESETGRRCAVLLSDDGQKPVQLAASTHASAAASAELEQEQKHGDCTGAEGGGEAEHETGAVEESQYTREALRAAECVRLLAPHSALPDGTTADSLLASATKAAAAAAAAEAARKASGEAELDADGVPKDPREAPAATAEQVAEAEQCKARGNEHHKQKKFAEAVEEYTAALRLYPRNERLWSNRSASNLLRGEAKLAERDALAATRLDPRFVKGYFRLGKARMAQGQYEDAAMAFWEGFRVDDTSAEMKKMMQQAVVKARQELHGKDVTTKLG